MRDLLVRYLLGELDAEKRELLEEQLLQSPELRRELEYLRGCLPSAEKSEPTFTGPPLGLAERTVDRVSDVVTGAPLFDDETSSRALAERAALASYAVEPPLVGLPSWNLADLTVAGGVFLAISMLFLPALRQSRDMARRNDCANNLRQLGVLLERYSQDHSGYFPLVGPTDNAGIFTVRLVREGYANADELARLLVCRSSPLANEISAGRVVIQFPSAGQFAAASPAELMELCRHSGGSYAYAIGYYEGGIYHGLRNERSPYAPIVADAPNDRLVDMQSPNHRGCGQNVLTADGGVHYQRTCTQAGQKDNIYLNEEGQPHAAHVKTDVVLIRSEATPGLVSADR
jgi:hypothetical protein